MELIKKIKIKLKNIFKTLNRNYFFTFVILMLTTIFLTVFINSSNANIIKMEISLLIWTVSLFFIETYFSKKINKILLFVLTALISITLAIFACSTNHFVLYNTISLIIGYVLILILLIFYRLISKKRTSLNEYFADFVQDFFFVSIYFLILYLGIILITLVFNELIIRLEYSQIFIREFILLAGLFYIPSIMYLMITENKDKDQKFISRLVNYVLSPLIMVAMLIIYIYIFKILILNEIPSNVIFRILAALYLVAMPAWLLGGHLENNQKVLRIIKSLPYLYCPFILLEIYSIVVRIIDNGMTPLRYLAVMLILFQIVELILEKVFKKPNLILIALVIITGISTIYPTNLLNTSVVWQSQILKNNYLSGSNFESLSTEQKKKVVGAYIYLKSTNIKSYISNYNEQEIRSIENSINKGNSQKYIIYNNYQTNLINVSGYKFLYYTNNITINSDKGFAEGEYNEGENFNVNLVSLMDNLKKKDPAEINLYMQDNAKIKIDDKRDFIVTYIDATYNDNTNSIDNITIDGYILER